MWCVTIQRVLARVDGDALDAVIGLWALAAARPQVIAVDGKEARGAKNGNGDRVHLMAALDHDTGMVLGQVDVGIKTNEITMFEPLLDTIKDLDGVVVTADALHTQRGHASYLHGRGAHCILSVKGNQPALHRQLTALPWKDVPVADRQRDRGHGRVSSRSIKVVSIAAGILFPHAAHAAPHEVGHESRNQSEYVLDMAHRSGFHGYPIRLSSLLHQPIHHVVIKLFARLAQRISNTVRPHVGDHLGQHCSLDLVHGGSGVRPPKELKREEGPEDLPVFRGQRPKALDRLLDDSRCLSFQPRQVLLKDVGSVRMTGQSVKVRPDSRMSGGDNQALSIPTSRTYLRRAVRTFLKSEAIQIELWNRVVPLADPNVDRTFL